MINIDIIRKLLESTDKEDHLLAQELIDNNINADLISALKSYFTAFETCDEINSSSTWNDIKTKIFECNNENRNVV
jgi:hypothetical protein